MTFQTLVLLLCAAIILEQVYSSHSAPPVGSAALGGADGLSPDAFYFELCMAPLIVNGSIPISRVFPSDRASEADFNDAFIALLPAYEIDEDGPANFADAIAARSIYRERIPYSQSSGSWDYFTVETLLGDPLFGRIKSFESETTMSPSGAYYKGEIIGVMVANMFAPLYYALPPIEDIRESDPTIGTKENPVLVIPIFQSSRKHSFRHNVQWSMSHLVLKEGVRAKEILGENGSSTSWSSVATNPVDHTLTKHPHLAPDGSYTHPTTEKTMGRVRDVIANPQTTPTIPIDETIVKDTVHIRFPAKRMKDVRPAETFQELHSFFIFIINPIDDSGTQMADLKLSGFLFGSAHYIDMRDPLTYLFREKSYTEPLVLIPVFEHRGWVPFTGKQLILSLDPITITKTIPVARFNTYLNRDLSEHTNSHLSDQDAYILSRISSPKSIVGVFDHNIEEGPSHSYMVLPTSVSIKGLCLLAFKYHSLVHSYPFPLTTQTLHHGEWFYATLCYFVQRTDTGLVHVDDELTSQDTVQSPGSQDIIMGPVAVTRTSKTAARHESFQGYA